ncbi:hypothetical protein L0337_15245 [candidate division KSB1 bacterium]|nr:hypothetical protein [candidate division KSB1 bacterium]
MDEFFFLQKELINSAIHWVSKTKPKLVRIFLSLTNRNDGIVKNTVRTIGMIPVVFFYLAQTRHLNQPAMTPEPQGAGAIQMETENPILRRQGILGKNQAMIEAILIEVELVKAFDFRANPKIAGMIPQERRYVITAQAGIIVEFISIILCFKRLVIEDDHAAVRAK